MAKELNRGRIVKVPPEEQSNNSRRLLQWLNLAEIPYVKT